MRALPADSVAYFGDTPDGKKALPAGLGPAGGAGLAAGGAAVGAGVVVGAGVAAAVALHCVLRNSFHDCPPRLFADFAAWYLALHSFAVSAPAEDVKARDKPAASAAAEMAEMMVAERMSMDGPPGFH